MTSKDYATSTQGDETCPRCGEGVLRAWYELNEEDREAARRLPASADFPAEERAARHRFCTRCWHEERADTPRVV